MQGKDHESPLENWLRGIRDVYRMYSSELDAIPDEKARYRRLTELNVIEQTLNVFKTGVVQRRRVLTAQDPAYEFPTPQIHAMIYDPTEGRLRELEVNWQSYMDEWKHLYTLHRK
jgi:carbonic anhydrase